MRITAAFIIRKGESTAEFLSAYDEIAVEAWGGVPDFYTEEITKLDAGDQVREMILNVPDADIETLFARPTVTVVTEPA